MIVIDFYAFQSIKKLSENKNLTTKKRIKVAYWSFNIFIYCFTFLALMNLLPFLNKSVYSLLRGLFSVYFFGKLIMTIPLLIEDIYRIIRKIIELISQIGRSKAESSPNNSKQLISRKKFISQVSTGMGLLTFSSLSYGIVKGAHDYKIHKKTVTIKNLPKGLKGLRIGQISDIHAGSFWDKSAVKRGIELLKAENVDILFFTGDLVNDLATEMTSDYQEIFGSLKAPLGVYSILGNHDYGDYFQWPDRDNGKAMQGKFQDKSHMSPLQLDNLEDLKKVHHNMSWQLLLNEHKILEFNSESFAVIGVENFGVRGRFPKYGNLKEAASGTETVSTKILLSHDPSHWDYEVLKQYPDINLTLSGHTHGAQFGIETAKFQWSPVKYMYKQWAGLYESNHQYLYVNRGFGYLGYPGRLGIRPEITVLTLS